MGIGLSSLGKMVGVVAAARLVVACCGCPSEPKAAAEATVPGSAPAHAALTAAAGGAVLAVKTCPGALVPAKDGLVDDLEDNNNQVLQVAGRGGYWWAAHDDKGSTIDPSGEVKMAEGGVTGSKYAVHVAGKNASGEGAWGANVGLRLVHGQPYDASKYAGISFFAKVGEKSGSTIRLKVADVNTHPDGKVCKDACWNDFGKDFSFSREFQEYKVSFAELKQQDGWGDPRPPSITPTQLIQIAWSMTTPGADFDLWLDDIRFLDCQ